jgi:hypothetical protein
MPDESDNVQIVLEAVERAKDQIDRTIKDLERLNQANDKSSSSFDRASNSARTHETALGKVKLAGIAAVAALTIVVEKAIQVGQAMVESAEKIIAQNAALFRTAQAAEVSTEAYSKLAFAAKLANVQQDELGVSMRRLAAAMVEARDPGSEAAQVFTQLGISTKGLENRKPTEVLLEMSDAFATHTGAAQKSAAATTLLGRGSKEMVGFLDQGSGAIKAQGVEAERLGAVLSHDAGKAAEEFSQKTDVLKASLTGLFTQAITPLLPILQGYADKLLELAKDKQFVITVTTSVITIFTTLAQIAIGVYTVFNVLGIAIGQGVALAFQIVEREVDGTIKLFNILLTGASKLLTTFIDMAGSLAGLGEAFSKALKGDFGGAAEAASNTFSAFGQKAVALAQTIKETAAATVDQIGTSVLGVGDEVATGTKRMADDIGKTIDAAARLNKALEPNAKASKPGEAGAATGTGAAAKKEELGTRSDPVAAAKAELKARKELTDALDNLDSSENEKAIAAVESAYQQRKINDLDYFKSYEKLLAEKVENERQAALETAGLAYDEQLREIDTLNVTAPQKAALKEKADSTYNAKVEAINATSTAKQIQNETKAREAHKAILAQRLDGTRNAFELMAQASEVFGKKGLIAYRVTASAAALIATYQNATQAYGAVVGIPYVGPALAIAAAAAAVVAGLANVAKINSISFAEGGIVPGAPSAVDNRVANVATGELIISAASTSALIGTVGMGGISKLLSGQVPMFGFENGPSVRPRSTASFATGGLVGDGAGQIARDSDNLAVSVGFLNGRNAQREFLRREGISVVIDELARRGNAVVA